MCRSLLLLITLFEIKVHLSSKIIGLGELIELLLPSAPRLAIAGACPDAIQEHFGAALLPVVITIQHVVRSRAQVVTANHREAVITCGAAEGLPTPSSPWCRKQAPLAFRGNRTTLDNSRERAELRPAFQLDIIISSIGFTAERSD